MSIKVPSLIPMLRISNSFPTLICLSHTLSITQPTHPAHRLGSLSTLTLFRCFDRFRRRRTSRRGYSTLRAYTPPPPPLPPPPPRVVMPGKQVRFSNIATLNEYTPQPSTQSSSTLSSSAGPVTPPSAYPAHLPYHYPAYPRHSYDHFPIRPPPMAPPPSAMRVQIHHRLQSNSGIMYDISLHPSTATTRSRHRFSSQELHEPATYPPTLYLEITCIHLPWRIRVSPSSGPFVSVGDVFAALYSSLRRNIVEDDYRTLSPNARHRVKEAYERRYRSIPDPRLYATEKQGGVKRVDYLMEKKWFMGLSSTSTPNVWLLQVS